MGVLLIGVFVVSVMILQFILYGTQQFITTTLHVLRVEAALMVNVTEGLVGRE